MTREELAKLIEIRDGLKNSYWCFDAWRWAAKFDQYIRDVEHSLNEEPFKPHQYVGGYCKNCGGSPMENAALGESNVCSRAAI